MTIFPKVSLSVFDQKEIYGTLMDFKSLDPHRIFKVTKP